MASGYPIPEYNEEDQKLQAEYFYWKCLKCEKLALSPLYLEDQHLANDSVIFIDINFTKWVKCSKCGCPFHLKCSGKTEQELAECEYLCTFLNCEQLVAYEKAVAIGERKK